jgi:hypothetical protein
VPRRRKAARAFHVDRSRELPRTLSDAQDRAASLSDQVLAAQVAAGGGSTWAEYGVWCAAMDELDARQRRRNRLRPGVLPIDRAAIQRPNAT